MTKKHHTLTSHNTRTTHIHPIKTKSTLANHKNQQSSQTFNKKIIIRKIHSQHRPNFKLNKIFVRKRVKHQYSFIKIKLAFFKTTCIRKISRNIRSNIKNSRSISYIASSIITNLANFRR